MLTFYLSLIEDVRDEFAFESIYRLNEKDVVNYIKSLVHNKNDAEDIAQDVWLCVCKHIEGFRQDHYKSVKNYIFIVAKYKALDFLEKKKKYAECFEDMDLFPTSFCEDDSVLLNLCAKAETKEIIECIRSLPPIYRDVINLCILGKNNSRKIADMLNLKHSTARQRLCRGRKMLIFLLKERGII